MFRVGQTVVHPEYGAGRIQQIRTLSSLGDAEKEYYAIQLIGDPATVVMVPLAREGQVGLRKPIPEAELKRVWRVLRADPKQLPSDYKRRCSLLEQRLSEGGLEAMAEVVRDLAARRESERRLTVRGKRFFEEAMQRLVSEVAGAEGSDFRTAESEIADALQTGGAPAAA